MTENTPKLDLLTTGVGGLDDVLGGGLPRRRVYLVQGDPGAGKTTLALQFLLEGERNGETGLYVTLSESREELLAVMRSHAWQPQMSIYELSVSQFATSEDEENTLYVPSEVELGERTQALVDEVKRVRPQRVVVDSCSELRLLAQSPLRFRRQLLALKTELTRQGCTVVLIDNPSSEGGNELLQSLVHGVIHMEQLSPAYGAERRRVRVLKLRERAFRGGYHDFIIRRGGITVFPRLVAAEHREPITREVLASGLTALDTMLGGGVDAGTSMLMIGPAGSGKSSLAMRYALTAAERGQTAALFTFDEGYRTLLARVGDSSPNIAAHIDAGRLRLQQVDPAELAPGQFADAVRAAVEQQATRVVIIDSLNGYLQAMPQEQFLMLHLHELLSYLGQLGVLTILVMSQHGLVGQTTAPVDISYLADTVVLTRFFEAEGRVRKALSIVKKRSGSHENTIRELAVSGNGVQIGDALTNFRGVLTGVPGLDGGGEHKLLEGSK